MSDVTVTEDAAVEPLAVGTNDFRAWAIGTGANVTPLGAYQTSPQLGVGVVTGIADPLIYNRAMRQATFIAAGIAQFVANQGLNVPDNGDLTSWIGNFTSAISITNDVPLFATQAQSNAGASANTIIAPLTLAGTLSAQVLRLSKLAADGTTQLSQTVVGPVNFSSAVQANGGFVTNSLTVQSTLSLPNGSVTSAMIANGTIVNADFANMPVLTVKANVSATTPGPPTDATIAAVLAAAGLSIPTSAHYQGQNQESGTAGGLGSQLGANVWTGRNLTYENPRNGAAGGIVAANLNSGEVTLPAGTYKVRASATCQSISQVMSLNHKIRLRDVGVGTVLAMGLNCAWDQGNGASPVNAVCMASMQGLFVWPGTPGNAVVLEFLGLPGLHGWQPGGGGGAGLAGRCGD